MSDLVRIDLNPSLLAILNAIFNESERNVSLYLDSTGKVFISAEPRTR